MYVINIIGQEMDVTTVLFLKRTEVQSFMKVFENGMSFGT